MADGYLNKCKECTKKYQKEKYYEKMNDLIFREKENIRRREKYKKYGLKRNNNPKFVINKKIHDNCKIQIKNRIFHHWSYDSKNKLDVFIMSKSSHTFIHKIIKRTSDKMLFKYNEEILDTPIKHANCIKNILNCRNIEYDLYYTNDMINFRKL